MCFLVWLSDSDFSLAAVYVQRTFFVLPKFSCSFSQSLRSVKVYVQLKFSESLVKLWLLKKSCSENNQFCLPIDCSLPVVGSLLLGRLCGQSLYGRGNALTAVGLPL